VVQGRAPGKLILAGEHAVVYGFPAIALAVERWTTVRLSPTVGPRHLGVCPFQDARLGLALDLALPDQGLRVDIESDIPVGRGMGSSAALTVALLRARAAWSGETLDFARLHAEGFAIERVFHGTPSGVDHAVSARGGALRYRRTEAGLSLEPIVVPDLELVVFDSGAPGDTGRMVAGVRARRPGIDRVLERIGTVTELVAATLARPQHAGTAVRELGPLLRENHELLREIGVSTPELDQIVAFACANGASGAKLAGAGGGGLVLALSESPTRLLQAATQAGMTAFSLRIAPTHEECA
jgi:mevalonate kinase